MAEIFHASPWLLDGHLSPLAPQRRSADLRPAQEGRSYVRDMHLVAAFISDEALKAVVGTAVSAAFIAVAKLWRDAKKGQEAERQEKEEAQKISRERQVALEQKEQALQEMGFWKNTAEAFKSELEAVKHTAVRLDLKVKDLDTEVTKLRSERDAFKSLGLAPELGQQILDCLHELSTSMHEFQAQNIEVLRFISTVQVQGAIDSPPPRRPRAAKKTQA